MAKKIQSSRRASLSVNLALITASIMFISFIVHMCYRGASAFPAGGELVDGTFLVEDHGKTYEFTPMQYWLSYVHGWAMLGSLLLYFLVVIFFSLKGDLRTVEVDPSA